MGEIMKSGAAGLIGMINAAPRLDGPFAGEALDTLDACYLRFQDGRVYRSLAAGTPANGIDGRARSSQVHGYAAHSANAGERVTLIYGTRATYGAGLTPHTPLYLSAAVPGGLTDVAPVAGASVIAKVETTTDIACGWLAVPAHARYF